MFARYFKPSVDSGGGGNAVLPPDTVQRAIGQMRDIVNEAVKATTDAMTGQLDQHRTNIEAKMKGIEELSNESIRLWKEQSRASTALPLSGKQVQLEAPLHRVPQIDEVLRTIDADGPYKDVQDTFDAIQIAESLRYGAFLSCGQLGNSYVVQAQKACDRLKGVFKDRVERAGMKGLDTGDIGGGINTGMSASLMGRYLLELQLAGYIPMFDHPLGIGDFKWPVMTSGTVGYLLSQMTGDMTATAAQTTYASQPLLTNVTFSPIVMGSRCDLSRELTEDTIFAVVPTVQSDLILALALATEYAVNSGDYSTTHMDADVTLSYDARKAFRGLRYKGLNGTGTKLDFGARAFDETQLGVMLKQSGKWLMNQQKRTAISASPSCWWQMLTQWPSLKYWNLWGSVGTMQTGTVPNVFGIPIVPSEDWRSMNSTGVVDSSATLNTRTGLVAFRTDQFKLGMKRGINLEAQYKPEYQAIMLIASTRFDFKEMRASATNPFVQYAYNITE
jgi:hypothetical protein